LKEILAYGSNYPIGLNDPRYYVQVPALLALVTGNGEQTIYKNWRVVSFHTTVAELVAKKGC